VDRRRQIVRRLCIAIQAAVLVAAACSHGPETTGQPKASDIRSLRWVSKDADRIAFLTTRPVACTHPPAPGGNVTAGDISDLDRYEIGRLAFESPALLGGAAARMGLSCSSCHLNGRGNAAFFIEGVSDKPGTADVTSSVFSKVRGDGNFNPVPIPDLAAKDGKQIKDRKGPEFKTKVHGLVVEEFDGQEPPPFVFDALIAYLDAQEISACQDPGASVLVRAVDDIGDASKAFHEAGLLERNGHHDDAQLMARAARDRLGRMHERFIAADQVGLRKALVAASRAIEGWASGRRELSEAERELTALSVLVLKYGPDSLYNPDRLKAAFARE
jgi:hypothetical protein